MSKIELESLKDMVRALKREVFDNVRSLLMPCCSSVRLAEDCRQALLVSKEQTEVHFLYPDSLPHAQEYGSAHWREAEVSWGKTDLALLTHHANGLPSLEPLLRMVAQGILEDTIQRAAVLMPTDAIQGFQDEGVLALRPNIFPLLGTKYCWAVYTMAACYPQFSGKWRLLEWRT